MKNYFILVCCCISFALYSCSDHKVPGDLLNGEAALPASFGFDQRHFQLINSSFNDKAGTVSLLYGNDKAKQQAMDSSRHEMGAQWALVTWKRTADEHWFGANIPGELLHVETVSVDSLNSGVPAMSYNRYSGKQLVKEGDGKPNPERVRFILAMQPAVMP